VETGGTRHLKGMPVWSPGGDALLYLSGWPGSAWLADADWGNERRIAELAITSSQAAWSPDGTKVVLTVTDRNFTNGAISVYDAATGHEIHRITPADLASTLWPESADPEGGYADAALSSDRQLEILWPMGWSADGRQLLVLGYAQAVHDDGLDPPPWVLAAVALDNSAALVLDYGKADVLSQARWSPTNPDRLIVLRLERTSSELTPAARLFDLEAGPIYTTTQVSGVWSPDGAWVAFAGDDGVDIVDEDGNERFSLQSGERCTDVVWNPTVFQAGRDEQP
jgi:hypothetical protein